MTEQNRFLQPRSEQASVPADSSEGQDFLTGGSAAVAAKWPRPGFIVEGTVIGWRGPMQRTDMETGEPLFFEGNRPVKLSALQFPQAARPARQLVIEIQCKPTGRTWETINYIEKPLPEDDGIRTLYVYGNLQKALSTALEKAGAKLEKNGYVKITRGEGMKTSSGFVAKTFSAEWTKPEDNVEVANAFVSGDGEDEPPF